jgi:hypothetical protein
MKGEGPDSCAVLTATTSGHPLSGATGAMEDHPTSIQVSIIKKILFRFLGPSRFNHSPRTHPQITVQYRAPSAVDPDPHHEESAEFW